MIGKLKGIKSNRKEYNALWNMADGVKGSKLIE
jgi:hypothetical protein